MSKEEDCKCDYYYNCCDCGGEDEWGCGCPYCFSCNACVKCLEEIE